MSDLEKLHLYLSVIDSDNLKTNIIKHLLQLNSFIFNIRSLNSRYNQNELPSNEDIQQFFKDFKYHRTISCVDNFQKSGVDQYLVYPYSYE